MTCNQSSCEFGISVLARYRRRGIATHLIRMLESWARSRRVERIELEVFGNNAFGIDLYRKLGFSEDKRKAGAMTLPDGGKVDLVHMQKDSDPQSGEPDDSGARNP